MDWSSILYAGIGGAFGGLIANLIGEKLSNKNLKAILLVVCVIFLSKGTNFLYKNGTLPRIVPINTTEITSDLPVLDSIRKINKSEYDKLIGFLDVPIRQGRLNAEDLKNFRAAYNKIILEYRSKTTAEVLRDFNEISVGQLSTFKDKQPEICTLQLHGRQFGDVSNLLSSKQAAQEQAVLVRMLDADNTLPVDTKSADTENGKVLFNKIITDEIFAHKLKDADPLPIEDGGKLKAHQDICDIMMGYTLKFNELNDSEIRNVFAYVDSMGQ